MDSNDDTPKIPDTADQMQRLFESVREMRSMLVRLTNDMTEVKTEIKEFREEFIEFRQEMRRELRMIKQSNLHLEERVEKLEERDERKQ